MPRFCSSCDKVIEYGKHEPHCLKSRESQNIEAVTDKLSDAYAEVLAFFEGNKEKADFWFSTPNPHFGGTSPNDLIKAGREHKVIQFINAAMYMNGTRDEP
jgi:uncharacterized protein (DUF2384 family)